MSNRKKIEFLIEEIDITKTAMEAMQDQLIRVSDHLMGLDKRTAMFVKEFKKK